MQGYGQGALSVALLTLAAVGVQACTTDPTIRDLAPQPTFRLAVVQADNGFIIRGLALPASAATALQSNAISLGDSVHFDRRALLPTNPKEIPHGETR